MTGAAAARSFAILYNGGSLVGMAVLAFGVIEAAAHASPTARLTYVRSAGAERCPDEDELRRAVAARLGYDPFFPWAPSSVVAEISRAKKGFRARVKIVDAQGLVRGERTLDASSEDCSDTLRALALAISIAVDDLDLERIPQPAPDATSPKAATVEPEGPNEAAATPPPAGRGEAAHPARPTGAAPSAFAIDAWLAPQVAFGVAPKGALGSHAAVDIRVHPISIGLEARADLPASATTELGGSVSTYVVLGTLAPCVRAPQPLLLCGLLSAGVFSESGVDVAEPRSGTAPYAAAGGRIRVDIPLSPTFFFVAHADLLATLTRHIVVLDGREVFTIPPMTAAFGFGFGAQFR